MLELILDRPEGASGIGEIGESMRHAGSAGDVRIDPDRPEGASGMGQIEQIALSS